MVFSRKRASASSPSRVSSTPPTVMRPAVGRSRPAMRPRSVDFPLPEGPAMARNCRAATSREMSLSTFTGLPPLDSRMERPAILIMVEFILHYAHAPLPPPPPPPPPPFPPRAPAPAPGSWAGAPRERVITCCGDSLTAGLGVLPEESYPAVLAARLKAEGYSYRVVNAGVSGDTTAGGLRRVDWALRLTPDIVILALGANDGLRGQDLAGVGPIPDLMVERFQQSGARVLLAGMRLPPNYGRPYAEEFRRMYAAV